jgi:triphosphatase
MPNEVELKFDLERGDVALVREAPVLASARSEAREHETVYFDTARHTLRQAGYSLRIRRTGDRFVQTLKHRNGGSVGLFVRGEWETEIPDLAPNLEAIKAGIAKRLATRIGSDPLLPLIRTRFSRIRWIVDYRGSRIEIVLDEGRVSGGEAEAPICEVEMELVRGRPKSLFSLAEEIGASVPLRLGVLSKGERGYALVEHVLGKAAGAQPLRLGAELESRAAFQIVAIACLRHFRLNEIALLSGERDVDALHQARVALRRLRTAFDLFHPILAGKEYRHLRDELRWFAAQLGAARDLDVLIAAAERPSQALKRRRDKAYEKVEAALRTPRCRSLLLRLASWIQGGVWRFRDGAAAPLGPLGRHQLDRLWRKVERRGTRIGSLDPDSRHRLRLDAKKLRYSAEFLSGLSPGRPVRPRRDRFIAALKGLQERLGEINDAGLDLPEAQSAKGSKGNSGSAPADSMIVAAQEAYDRAVEAAGYWRG